MKELEFLYFPDEASFRSWLEINHEKSPGIWMVFYKKHTGKECIGYPEALDSALCYGWIDSIIKKMDENCYARKFTPRSNTANWSEYKMKRIAELIRNGKMTNAGLNKIESYVKNGAVDLTKAEPAFKKPSRLPVPDYLTREFAENEPALTNFNLLSPSCQREYLLWITTAKREDTRNKRIAETIRLLNENKKLGLK